MCLCYDHSLFNIRSDIHASIRWSHILLQSIYITICMSVYVVKEDFIFLFCERKKRTIISCQLFYVIGFLSTSLIHSSPHTCHSCGVQPLPHVQHTFDKMEGCMWWQVARCMVYTWCSVWVTHVVVYEWHMLWCMQGTLGVVHALQGTLGVLHERQMISVFMHVSKLWLASPINKTMNKHSQHTTREEQQEARKKESLAQEIVILIESFLVREIVSQFVREFLTNWEIHCSEIHLRVKLLYSYYHYSGVFKRPKGPVVFPFLTLRMFSTLKFSLCHYAYFSRFR